MTGGVTAATVASYAATAASVIGAVKTLTTKSPKGPEKQAAFDPGAADAAASAEASRMKIAQRRAARANSLLSAAGAAGDMSTTGATMGKAALGE